MAITISTPIFIFIAVLFRVVTNDSIELPLTITPLLQDGITMGNFSKLLRNTDPTYYSMVTFSDIIKGLQYIPGTEMKKTLEALVILGAAAKSNGLTVQQFEFRERSRWSINISAHDLANVSTAFTLPLNDSVTLKAIQEAMFRILEQRFQFRTAELVQRFNKSVDEIYSVLEPGWINIVHFIIENNILRLSKTYDIPPFYIAEALNMSQHKLFNSTLPQLEDILKNKIEIIKAAAERLRKASSTLVLTTSVPSSAYPGMMSSWTTKTTTLTVNNSTNSAIWTVNSTMRAINSTTRVINSTIPMKIDKTTNSVEQSTYTNLVASNTPMSKTLISSTSLTTPLISHKLYITSLPLTQSTRLSSETTVTQITSGSNFRSSNTSEYHINSINPTSISKIMSTFTYTKTTPPGNEKTANTSSISTHSLLSHDIHLTTSTTKMVSNNNSVAFPSPTIAFKTSTIPTSEIISSFSHSTNVKRNSTPTLTSSEFQIIFSSVKNSSTIKTSKFTTTSMKPSLSTNHRLTVTTLPKTSLVFASSLNRAAGTTSSSWKTSTSFPPSTMSSYQDINNLQSLSDISRYPPTSVYSGSYTTAQTHSEIFSGSTISASWDSSTTTLLSSSMTSKYESSTSTFERSDVMQSSSSIMTSVYHGVTEAMSDDDFDPVVYIVVPVTALLVLVALIIGILFWWKNRSHIIRNRRNAELGSELVASLENINKQRSSDYVNRGAEDRPSRSMSRASSVSNLETIHEGHEPAQPEIYDL